MKKRLLGKYDYISIIICLLAIIPGAIVFKTLPDKVPIHFNINGEADGFASRGFAVFGLPLILTAIQIVLCVVTNLAWKEERKGRGEIAVKILPAIVFYVIQIWLLLHVQGKVTDVSSFAGLVLSVLFLVIGNYLPKVRRNAFYGIRTPHTLAAPEVWDKTHRFAGPFIFVTGILCMIATVMGMHLWVLFVIILLALIIPLIYSEIVYRNYKKNAVNNNDKETENDDEQ